MTMSSKPVVSVIVSNYNYAEFVGSAICSALDQTYPHVEVIVVDDGSTDDSSVVLQSFGDRISTVFKENSGQSSALNCGFAASTGEIVLFLDADDVLHRDIVETVVSAFDKQPDLVKVQFKMREIDESGEPTGNVVPKPHRRLRSGDLRRYFERHHMYAWPWTSAVAYRRSLLEYLLPIPERIYQNNPDEYLAYASVMVGPIMWLDRYGCSYRVHGRNTFTTRELNLESTRRMVKRFYKGHSVLKAIADANGLDSFPNTADGFQNLNLLVPQVTSYKLDPANHPVPTDGTLKLLRRTYSSTLGNPEFRARHQLAHALWLSALLCSPRRVANWLCNIRHN
jgi:glycosyltransferase involved in cell wall biosynthesis